MVSQLNADNAWTYCNRGIAYADLGQHRRAIEDFGKAIELVPSHASTYINRGNVYTRLDQHAKAQEDHAKGKSLRSG